MKTSFDFYQHVSLHVKALKLFGFWYKVPYQMNSIWFWITVVNRIVMGMFGFVIFTGVQIVYLVRLLLSGNSDIIEVTGIVNLVCTELLTEFQLLNMFLCRNKLSNLIKELNNEDFQCHSQFERKICEEAVKKSRRLFVALLFGATLDVFVHVVVVPSLNMFESLPLKMDFLFFDVNDTKYYKYVCFYQIVCKPWMLVGFMALHAMPWAAMLFVMSQLDVLIYNFENMKELVKSTRAEINCDENEAFRLIFRRLILHHSSIIRFTNLIQDTFGGQQLANLFVSTSVMGTTALQFFSIESPSTHLVDVFWICAYVIIFLLMLFLDCYFGNSITIKCEHLSTCVYFSSWLNLDNDLKKTVIMFIAKTQQPIVITAAKLVPMSLYTFTKVMNWTYKGFALMNQMR